MASTAGVITDGVSEQNRRKAGGIELLSYCGYRLGINGAEGRRMLAQVIRPEPAAASIERVDASPAEVAVDSARVPAA